MKLLNGISMNEDEQKIGEIVWTVIKFRIQ